MIAPVLAVVLGVILAASILYLGTDGFTFPATDGGAS